MKKEIKNRVSLSETKGNHNKLIEKLYRDDYCYFYKIAYSILENETDTEDAVNKSFLKFYTYIDRMSKAEYPKIKAYLANVVRSVSIDLKKKQNKIVFSEFPETLIDIVTFSEGVDVILERMFENRSLYALLKQLSVKERTMIKFKIIDELTFKEISKIMSISEEATRKKYRRTLKKLQKLMEEKGIRI